MARPRMSGQLYMTQVTEATSKPNCPKIDFSRPLAIWRPLKILPPSCKFLRRSARDICSRTKKIVSYRRFSWGLPFHARPTRFRKL